MFAIHNGHIWPEIDDFGTPKGVILGVVWGTISVTQNRTFSRSLLDHFFFIKTLNFVFFKFLQNLKIRSRFPHYSPSLFLENTKLLVFLLFCLNETDPRFAKDTWAQIRCLLFVHHFSRKSDYFTLSFASDKSVNFQERLKCWSQPTLFVFVLTRACFWWGWPRPTSTTVM